MHYHVNWPQHLCNHSDSPRKNLVELWFTHFPLCVLNWWIPSCFPRGRGLFYNSIGAIHPLEESECWRWCRCQPRWIAGVSGAGRGTRPRPSLDYSNQNPLHGLFISVAPLHSCSLCDYFFLQCCPSDHGDPQQRPAELHRGQDGGAGGASEQSSRFPGEHPQQVSAIPWNPPSFPPWAGPLSKASFPLQFEGKNEESLR